MGVGFEGHCLAMSITLLEAQAALDGAPSLFVNSERGYVSSLAREKMQSHAKATRESFVADKGKRGLSLLGGFRASREFGAAIGRRHHHVVSTGKLMVVLCAAILYAAHADAPKVAAVAAAAGSEKGPKEKKGKKKKKQKGGDAVAATQSLQSTFVFGDFLAQETEQEAPGMQERPFFFVFFFVVHAPLPTHRGLPDQRPGGGRDVVRRRAHHPDARQQHVGDVAAAATAVQRFGRRQQRRR